MNDHALRADGTGDDAIGAPVDLAEWGGDYVVQVDLPGFRREDLDVSVAGTTLRIKTDRRESMDVPMEAFHHRERDVRPVERTVDLPKTVDGDALTTEFDDGVLTVRLPKDYDRTG